LRLLAPRAGETLADCTAGLGGHAAIFARAMGVGRVVLNDVDPSNLAIAERTVREAAPACEVLAIRGNYAGLPHALRERGIVADMVLADLGFSSNQMDDPSRGFSFMRDGPLDMRLDPSLPTSARELVASASERDLAQIIAEFGEDRASAKIARKIVEIRRSSPIATTQDLSRAVRAAVGRGDGAIDPATRTFQALRIATNDELGGLDALLASFSREAKQVLTKEEVGGRQGWLARGARIAIISFHSLEDRLVKRAFAGLIKDGARDLSEGPVTPSEAEIASNPRSRSAKLRAIAVE
jgi:16S rRNA (cytosine1402-N4)-methyltransferase